MAEQIGHIATAAGARRQAVPDNLGPVDKVDSQIGGSMIQSCLLGGGFGAWRFDGFGMEDR